ncbi:MAG: ABC transporter ATP-binding protein, partial [Actinomycetota bacterium]|nr:ABC transporter ATP-binding protein [Actinomycetota bacterium]
KRKCIRKIREVQEQGTTIFLVSHNARQVQKLCDRALVLDEGSLVYDGDPAQAAKYLNQGIEETDEEADSTDF